jgi:hypothetical protein
MTRKTESFADSLNNKASKTGKTFKTHNDNIDWVGGGRLGYLTTTYAALKRTFGESSTNFDDYKCDAEWSVEFDNGLTANIYNYKNGKNYLGKDGTPKTQITNWNIGGTDEAVIDLIKQALKG